MTAVTETIYVDLNALGIKNDIAEELNIYSDDVAKVIQNMFAQLKIPMTVEAEHPMNFNEEDGKAAEQALGEDHGKVMKLTLTL